MHRAIFAAGLLLAVAGCGRKPSGDKPGPSHSVDPGAAGARRDALITLAALQTAAALESNEGDRRRFLDMGLFHLVEQPDAPLRHEVLEHVRAWAPATRLRSLAFVRAHPTYSTLYHAYVVESFGPPPSFAPRGRGPATVHNAPALATDEAAAEFSALLRDAWSAGGVSELAKKLAPGWDALQFSPALTAKKKADVLAYLGFARPETLPRFSVVYDPLLRNLNGYGSTPEDGEILLIVGPSGDEKEREMVLVHEFTHLPLTKVLERDDIQRAFERAACAEPKIGDHKSYDGFQNYTIETLVRAISYRVANVPPRADSGFLFEPFFGEELVAYEARPKRDFAAFAPGLFDDLARRYCAP